MKLSFVILTIFFVSSILRGQSIDGFVIDNLGSGIPFVKIENLNTQKVVKSATNGSFLLTANMGDTLLFSAFDFDSLRIILKKDDFSKSLKIKLTYRLELIDEVTVTENRLKEFDVGFLPPVKGVQIYTGTNAVIELEKLSGAKSTGNPREIFAKIPGLNIWESDGAGIQIGIGGRGLSPNRAANFNTRQNGYDISADALGYPESYYTPPIEALKSIEIIRGSASLQYGTQFGGLLNFVFREPPSSTPLELTSRITGGAYGYIGTFNRVAGTFNRFSYQLYHQYKSGTGFRENSDFHQHQAFGQLGYRINEASQIRLEYTKMTYLAQQAGGLTDVQYNTNQRSSFRNRNWFKVDWNVLALHYDYEFSKSTVFNVRAFGVKSERSALGFLGKISQADPGGFRQIIKGDFKNAGIESRIMHKYSFEKFKGAVLIGGRAYAGNSSSVQGHGSNGDDANFNFNNPNNVENSSYVFPSSNLSGFIENIVFLGSKWTLNVGTRFEHIQSASEGFYKRYSIHPFTNDTLAVYTIFDTNEVARNLPLFGLGGSRKIGKSASIYANLTQNFRAVNFTDIRVSNPNIVIDTLIKDEYGFTSELGFRGLFSDFFIYDFAAFSLFYGDKIGLAPKFGTTFKERTNIGDALNLGIELFTELDFIKAFKDSSNHGLTLFINTAYIHARYIRSKEKNYVGKQVEYVSPFMLKSGIKWKSPKMTYQVQGSYNSAQFSDASNAVEPSGDAVIGLIPSYFVFDFSARYFVSKFVTMEAGVNNFTNQKYFTRRASAYPGPGILPSDGINAYITLQIQLKTKRF